MIKIRLDPPSCPDILKNYTSYWNSEENVLVILTFSGICYKYELHAKRVTTEAGHETD